MDIIIRSCWVSRFSNSFFFPADIELSRTPHPQSISLCSTHHCHNPNCTWQIIKSKKMFPTLMKSQWCFFAFTLTWHHYNDTLLCDCRLGTLKSWQSSLLVSVRADSIKQKLIYYILEQISKNWLISILFKVNRNDTIMVPFGCAQFLYFSFFWCRPIFLLSLSSLELCGWDMVWQKHF